MKVVEMSGSSKLILLDAQSTDPEVYLVVPDKLIEGNPQQRLWNLYTDATGQNFSGFWESDAGKWSVCYTEEQIYHLIEGVGIVTDSQGNATTLRAGDHFVIPKGFEGAREVVEPTRKLYAIYEAAAS